MTQRETSPSSPTLPPSVPPPVPPPPRYKGVGGWLLFYCVSLTILSPLATIVTLVGSLAVTAGVFDRYPGLLVVTIVDSVISAALMGFSIYAGVGLWRVRPNAVKVAKTYMLCFLVYLVISAFIPFMAGLPSSANEAMLAEVVKGGVQGLIYFGIWFSYLNTSERVKATYTT